MDQNAKHFFIKTQDSVIAKYAIPLSEDSLSRGGSVSPPMSPDLSNRGSPSQDENRELKQEKIIPSPTKLPEQKPFRGFDITSLIRKDDDNKDR